MFAFVTIVEPQIDSLNTARKGALKSYIFGAPKAGDRWNVPVLCSFFLPIFCFRRVRCRCLDVGRTALRNEKLVG